MLRQCSLLVPLLLVLAACGLDETYTGMGEGALPGDPLHPSAQEGGTCAAPAECPSCEVSLGTMEEEDLTGQSYRFDALSFTAPLSGMFGDELNNLLQKEIAAGGLNILLLVDDHQVETGALSLYVGAGEAVGDAFGFLGDPGFLGGRLLGQVFVTEEPSSLVIPNGMLDPPELPIMDLRLLGILAADGGAISEGDLRGVLTGDAAGEITIAGQSLAVLLEGLGVPRDLDLDADGTPDAWQFLGRFTASQVGLAN
ncbi:MAG: hypothetical protein ABIK09_13555 [Pseudomonadota bacterium]